MITQEEFTALTQLLQRTPMSAAEAQWTQAFLMRLQAQLAQQALAMDKMQRATRQVPKTESVKEAELEGTTEEQ